MKPSVKTVGAIAILASPVVVGADLAAEPIRDEVTGRPDVWKFIIYA